MALSHEVFTDAQINGPKNVMGYPDVARRYVFPEKPKSVFEVIAPNAAPEVIAFLRLAEREGAYARLSEKRRKTLEMRYAEGLSMPQIADVLGISKQAVSQSLKLSPESLFKQMTKDVNARRTPISFREILAAYSGYRIYLDKNRKRRE